MRSVSFYSDGEVIYGHLYMPERTSPRNGFPAVVLCNGFAAVKEMLVPRFAEGFSQNGYAVLTFDYRGFGESDGKPRIIWSNQVRDVRSAVTFMQSVDGVNPDSIALWGTALGGANAVMAAARDRRVKCVVVQVTFGDGERVLFRGKGDDEIFRLRTSIEQFWMKEVLTGQTLYMGMNRFFNDEASKAFFDANVDRYDALKVKLPFATFRELMSLKPEHHIPEVSQPILIVAAENDSVNPKTESERLFARAGGPRSLFVIPGVDHFDIYQGDAFGQAFSEELRWFGRYLTEPSAGGVSI